MSRVTISSVVLYLLGVGTSHALAATPLPYSEALGDIVTSGCDTQWKNGDCESGWRGWGDDDTLDMVTAVGVSPSEHGIKVTPGTDFWNGIQRDFDITAGKVLEWTFPVHTIDGTAKYAVRVAFKNAAGATLSVQSQVTVVDGYDLVTSYFLAPANTSTVTVFMGVKDRSSEDTVAVFSGFCAWLLAGCVGGGHEVENFPDLQVCNPPPACPGCPLCPDGVEAVETCLIDHVECELLHHACKCPADKEVEDIEWL